MPGPAERAKQLQPFADCITARYKPTYQQDMLEVGVFEGASTLFWAQCFKRVSAVDAWSIDAITNELDVVRRTLTQPVFDAARRVALERLPIHDRNFTLYNFASIDAAKIIKRKFDGIYLDGDHSESGITADLDVWLPKCKAWIGGHDYGDTWPAVRAIVDEMFGDRVIVFDDTSWLVFLA